MTLLAIERMKLFSTRAPWWSIVIALALTIGFASLFAAQSGPEFPLTVSLAMQGWRFGLIVVMVLAALAVTTEYRFGTIKATFQAVPNRTAVMLAKTAVVAFLGLIIGELAAFGSLLAARILGPNADLALNSGADWRQVAGIGVVYAGAAVLAVAVGMLLRQTAGAVTLLTIWVLLAESLISVIPSIGDDIYDWLPFSSAARFLGGGGEAMGRAAAEAPLGPWASLVYFLAIVLGFLIFALVTVNRRDA